MGKLGEIRLIKELYSNNKKKLLNALGVHRRYGTDLLTQLSQAQILFAMNSLPPQSKNCHSSEWVGIVTALRIAQITWGEQDFRKPGMPAPGKDLIA